MITAALMARTRGMQHCHCSRLTHGLTPFHSCCFDTIQLKCKRFMHWMERSWRKKNEWRRQQWHPQKTYTFIFYTFVHQLRWVLLWLNGAGAAKSVRIPFRRLRKLRRFDSIRGVGPIENIDVVNCQREKERAIPREIYIFDYSSHEFLWRVVREMCLMAMYVRWIYDIRYIYYRSWVVSETEHDSTAERKRFIILAGGPIEGTNLNKF